MIPEYEVYDLTRTVSPDSLAHPYIGTVYGLSEAKDLLGHRAGYVVNTQTLRRIEVTA